MSCPTRTPVATRSPVPFCPCVRIIGSAGGSGQRRRRFMFRIQPPRRARWRVRPVALFPRSGWPSPRRKAASNRIQTREERSMQPGPVSRFIDHHYRHFNAAALVAAADGYTKHLNDGGVMFMTLAGAMSTAELGLSLAEMIRQKKVSAICCTGAKLEADIFNLVAHDHYERVPNYRDLTPQDEQALLDRHLNRVTDTCIPEGEAMRRIEGVVLEEWVAADKKGERLFPHEFLFRVLKSGKLKSQYQIDPKNSWLMAAAEADLPMIVPGWEDATLGNMYAGHVMEGDVKNVHTVKTGIEYMMYLAEWYTNTSAQSSIGFFQIGGGIAG